MKYRAFVDSLHDTVLLKKGEHFIESKSECSSLGRLQKGIVRGYLMDNDGNEITTHFYQEGDMLIGSFIPNVRAEMSLICFTS